MHLPREIWESIAAFEGVTGMAGATKVLRDAWYQKRTLEKNPHVAYVRRSRLDIQHMNFCQQLDFELSKCPQRQLSCWNFFSINVSFLNTAERQVLSALAARLKTNFNETIQLEFSSRGVLMRSENSKRRAKAVQVGAQYDPGIWSLYMRLVLLPPMTRVHARAIGTLSFLNKNGNALTSRRPWKVGRQITVLRSRSGLNAVHCMNENKPSSKGAFQWLYRGVTLPNYFIDLKIANPDHPFITLVDTKNFRVSASDMLSYDSPTLTQWP